MRKEIIIALIIGLCLGLVVAFGIRSARLSLATRRNLSPTPLAIVNRDNNPNSTHSIFISVPEPYTITDQEKLTIIGNTTVNALVSVVSNSDQIATNADQSGAFTAAVTLEAGLNNIEIKSYNDQGETATTSFIVIYSTADLAATESAQTKEWNN